MNQNQNVEMGLLCEEIKGLRNEIQAMREMLQQDLHKRPSVNVEKTVVEPIEKGDLDSQVSSMLLRYQIPVHIKGFKYIKEAIKMEIEEGALAAGITKVVYPSIAKKYNDHTSRVERAIRHAIESAWYKSKHEYFFSKMMDKPSNGYFIALMAEQVRLGKIEYSA
ncbi:sporulation initiation factor Spo0A C-terminal domain-containing protein [Cytobacillus oceanisediminis]|uniref:sporulation initiation factor Spo0A C-terminal domain-containing protein n=1 Tax=Cytobacillus oceanisediminis TaxID=665099 RepID=UPI0020799D21|nr:sporulation initiation factor Spo0A C-terminal domain-containing protein [Cytobacillus oceanisediminis]USK43738.1 sporulation initiation factor Spo0A C-terminal domain-containing protein [Cytobacillus oceanisediminis]